MQAEIHQTQEFTQMRDHPYEGAEYDARVRYYNFVENPELIRQVLEDFKPWEKYDSIDSFYSFLEWVNRSDGILESSDCRLRPGQPLQGRVMVLFRDISLNLAKVDDKRFEVNENLVKLAYSLSEQLKLIKSYSKVDMYFTQTHFKNAAPPRQFGQQLMIQFDCSGMSEVGRFKKFGILVNSLKQILEELEGYFPL